MIQMIIVKIIITKGVVSKRPVGQYHYVINNSANNFSCLFILHSFTLEVVALCGLKRTNVSTLILEVRL